MTVLGTIFKQSHSSRHGFVSIKDFMDDKTMYYTFDSIFKVHNSNFDSWVVYWEGSPLAVKCSVKADVLANGFVKVAILSKDLVQVQDIGEYTSTSLYVWGKDFGGKFGTNREIAKYASDFATQFTNAKIAENPAAQKSMQEAMRYANSKVIPDAKAEEYKEIMAKNWGCTFKD